MGGVIGVACPQIIYPYLRGNVADVVTRAGFPPVHLAEINFQAMYEQQAAAAAQAEGHCPSKHRRQAALVPRADVLWTRRPCGASLHRHRHPAALLRVRIFGYLWPAAPHQGGCASAYHAGCMSRAALQRRGTNQVPLKPMETAQQL
jgi:hypothetical protein